MCKRTIRTTTGNGPRTSTTSDNNESTKHAQNTLTSPAQFAPWNLKQVYNGIQAYDYVSSFLGLRTLMLSP